MILSDQILLEYTGIFLFNCSVDEILMVEVLKDFKSTIFGLNLFFYICSTHSDICI